MSKLDAFFPNHTIFHLRPISSLLRSQRCTSSSSSSSFFRKFVFSSFCSSRKSVRVRINQNTQVRGMLNGSSCTDWSDVVVNRGGENEVDDSDIPVEICYTRDLAPALTLREGVERIKEAVVKLKEDPPCSSSGVIRFQVRIPPSPSAVDWFHSLYNVDAFPQFHILSKSNDTRQVAVLDGMIGVSGIGAAIFIPGSSYISKQNNVARYLSVDSPLIRAYGFIGNNYSKESSLTNDNDGPVCIFIPQIELDEFEGSSLLASAIIWDSHRCHTFQYAIQSAKLYLDKLMFCGRSVDQVLHNLEYIRGQGDPSLITAKETQVICFSAENLCRLDTEPNVSLLKQSGDHYQYCFRLSHTQCFANRLVAHSCGFNFPLNEFPNINALWAFLIVEECVRLGSMYFCVAPGSRSSPLAVAAATHPRTTCISCFDERSLAFHAVGYAKGSGKPAVIITTSGTAVSNLFPAVVEASQDFVPLLLLTADRPQELLNTGANQAINQVDHFGKFVRFFFNLPPPSDEILSRMVLTTIDSAVYNATQAPCGPAHINCPFREPLDNSPSEWSSSCLKGLDKWISNSKPFTKYINVQNLCTGDPGQLNEVVQIIRGAKKGFLLLGTINTECEIWAALLLAKHLYWPVVADILSGLRLRRLFSSHHHAKNQLLFIDHLDHALLSELVANWGKPDVVLQLGSRVTSKRVAQFLEHCLPSSYILVDKHPCRHDPLHLVSLRIESTISIFAEVLLKVQVCRKMTKWRSFWQTIDSMVSEEISQQICLEHTLTEPYVAHIIAFALHTDAVLFVGNSMVIRDVDMYGKGWAETVPSLASFSQRFPYQGIQVVGNRGASGIDGLLSTASGFAVGCDKKVLCLIGDVSFLHDTNGLAILSERVQRKPMTVLVINNHGGAIFSLLPIAERTKSDILEKFFYTSHNISIGMLCAAHSIEHLYVRTKVELDHALSRSRSSNTDIVIEVESCVSDNSNFHSLLRRSACKVAHQTLKTLLMVSDQGHEYILSCRINKMEFSLYRIQLSSLPTSSPMINDSNEIYKEGFVLSLTLDDGTKGYGEVAPIEIHKEDMGDVEEQLRFLVHIIEGSEIKFLSLFCGSISSWFSRTLGIMPSSLFPSVRCGIEMAVLHALGKKRASAQPGGVHRSVDMFLKMAFESNTSENRKKESSSHVQICALVDCNGSPSEVVHVVSRLVDEGFTTIKLKVARRASPTEDAAVIQEIRNTLGSDINIRVDANRKWTYDEALQFGFCVKSCGLQYIEEPVQSEVDIVKFCDAISLPVALDETIDNLKGDIINELNNYLHPGIVAVVIKPSVIGGFEIALLIASWAEKHGKMVIVSSAFETSLSLSAYVQFSLFLQHWSKFCKEKTEGLGLSIAQGLGTYKWLKEDISIKPFKLHIHRHGGTVGIFEENASKILEEFQINRKAIQRSYDGEEVLSYCLEVANQNYSCSIRLLETKANLNQLVTVFLHGLLGVGEEWVPIMKAISAKTRCISIDLPGHGQSQLMRKNEKELDQECDVSVELVGDILYKLLCDITIGSVLLVGYSLGARIALYMSLKYKQKIQGAVLISGSPGLKDNSTRRLRAAQDDAKSRILLAHGLHYFTELWYQSKLWNSLRNHPHFEQIRRTREKHHDYHAIAKSLSNLSVGRQLPLWEDLKQLNSPLLLIVGEKDKKFKDVAQQMLDEINPTGVNGCNPGRKLCSILEVSECGHAVHLENPLAVINAIGRFIRELQAE